jgi:hypothetical protein
MSSPYRAPSPPPAEPAPKLRSWWHPDWFQLATVVAINIAFQALRECRWMQ